MNIDQVFRKLSGKISDIGPEHSSLNFKKNPRNA